MPDTDENIRKSEEFIRKVLKRNFDQDVDAEQAAKAAEKLRGSIPASKKTGVAA